MISTYYLDESGNTGDVIKAGPQFDFDRQPIFVLACIGIEDSEELARELERLRAAHKIKAGELKASALTTRPRFVADLIRYLWSGRAPILIEVVEKRFFICIQLVERLLLPPVGGDFDLAPETQLIKNVFADHLRMFIPDEVLRAYIAACEVPGAEAVRAAFKAFRTWLESRPQDEVAAGMLKFLLDEQADFENLGLSDEEAISKPLPIPDAGLRGKRVWMLPNLTSFTNIYGRLNLLHRGKLNGVTLVHDDQPYFENILREGKVSMEGLAAMGFKARHPHSDYNFTENATLTFARSDEAPGIQAADVVAGFLMRFTKDVLAGDEVSKEHTRTFWTLMDAAPPGRGKGINFVVSSRDLSALGIEAA